jgi:transposase
LGGISKRGNRYLRRMFVHGARAVLLRVQYDTGGFGRWVRARAAADHTRPVRLRAFRPVLLL